jgi:hypothetical protein
VNQRIAPGNSIDQTCNKKAAPQGSRLYRHQYVVLGIQSPAKWYLKVSSKSSLPKPGPGTGTRHLLRSGDGKLGQTVSKNPLRVNPTAMFDKNASTWKFFVAILLQKGPGSSVGIESNQGLGHGGSPGRASAAGRPIYGSDDLRACRATGPRYRRRTRHRL